MSIIQAENIRHSYDSNNYVLKGVSIRLEAGSALAITMLPHVVALGMMDAARIARLNLGKFEKDPAAKCAGAACSTRLNLDKFERVPADKCANAARIAQLNLGKFERVPADKCANAARIARLNLLQGWGERS